MSEDITVLRLDDRERWEAEHRQGGLPSQSWNYAFGLSASGFDPKLAIVRSKGARMLLPFFERSFMGTTDIATIPGLSGARYDELCERAGVVAGETWFPAYRGKVLQPGLEES
jgi:CelD/BcsL family acetyltransferase involved in cellulose biosynthesis